MSRPIEQSWWTRPRVAGVAALALLALASTASAVAVGYAVHRHAQRSQDRSDALAAARTDTVALQSYSYRNLDGEVAANSKLVTPHFREIYAKQLLTVVAPVATRRHMAVAARASDVAIQTLSNGRATVLVADDQVTYTGDKASPVASYRLRMQLVRSHGTWLVDDLTAV